MMPNLQDRRIESAIKKAADRNGCDKKTKS